MNRLLVVGLDGFDPEVARQLLAQGKLPNLARLARESHRFELDPGIERYTGLAWEAFSSGLTPEQSCRWSANIFDTARYWPDQPNTHLTPFTEFLPARTAVFDLPYFDLSRTSRAQGMVSWGAHDPGAPQNAKPEGLLDEILQRFGAYPAQRYIYGHVWRDPAETAAMAAAMEVAVQRRSDIVSWLFGQRLQDWDLAIAVISEYHSATEALWHGWDESHPLHGHPSSAAARQGIIAVYEAADRMLGRLQHEFPDTPLLAFTPHGMGANTADNPAMLLLPELLYRHYSGRIGFQGDAAWALDGSGGENLPPGENWSVSMMRRLNIQPIGGGPRPPFPKSPLDWMPASQYRVAWPGMRAFALPAYYEGMIRLNLKGREQRGIVPRGEYREEAERVAALVRACADPITGEPIAADISFRDGDPGKRHPTDCDIAVRFPKAYFAFRHPTLGLIGPAPCRRPGGHTGGRGAGYLCSSRPGERADLGVFRTGEISGAIGAWVQGASSEAAGVEGGSTLGAALLRAAAPGSRPAEPAVTTTVDICIATFKRLTLLRDLLNSLLEQRTSPDIALRVIVIDNDAGQSARTVVEEFTATKLAAAYECEPERNISRARNRALGLATAEWIATIDDDAVADPDWIQNLADSARRYKADIVFGAVERRLPPGAPDYLQGSRIFDLWNPPTGTSADLVYNTINSFFRRSLIAGRPAPFRLEYGLTGGEDTYLFYDLQVRCHARTVWCREAKVVESVLPGRATLRWRLRRSFREGTTRYRVYRLWNIRPDVPLPYRFLHLGRWLAETSVRIAAGMIRGITDRKSRHLAIWRLNQLVYNLGIAAQTLGLGVTEYKRPPKAA